MQAIACSSNTVSVQSYRNRLEDHTLTVIEPHATAYALFVALGHEQFERSIHSWMCPDVWACSATCMHDVPV